MLHITLTPDQRDRVDELVEEYNVLAPHRILGRDDELRLEFEYANAIPVRCVEDAARKVFSKDIRVQTDDTRLEIYDEYSRCIDRDILNALSRYLYISDSKKAKRNLERFAAKWGLTTFGPCLELPKDWASKYSPSSNSDIDKDTVSDDDGLSRENDSSVPGGSSLPGDGYSDLDDQLTPENGGKTDQTIYNIYDGQNPPQFDTTSPDSRNHDWDEMLNNCQLAQEFESREVKLSHKQLWGVMTNYISVRGGKERFKSALALQPGYGEKMQRNWLYEIRVARERGYKPTRCDKYCPYSEKCLHSKNMLEQVLRPGHVRVTQEPRERISIEEAQQKTLEVVSEILEDYTEEDAIHLVIVPTGVGKTEAILQARNAIVAAPTHALAERNHKRMLDAGNEAIIVGDVPDYSKDFDESYKRLHELGAHNIASAMLHSEVQEIEKKLKEKKPLTDAEQRLLDYEKSLRWFYDTKLTANITHARALNLRHRNTRDIVIFDEDPLITALAITEADMTDLLTLKSKAQRECKDRQVTAVIERLVEAIEDASNGQFMDVPSLLCPNYKDLARFVVSHQVLMNSNILGIFEAKKFVKVQRGRAGKNGCKEVVVSVRTPQLPAGRVIVLSATANSEIYSLAFPGRKVVVHEVGPVEAKGKLLQCVRHSLSKTYLDHIESEALDKVIQQIVDVVGDRPVITRKDLKPILAKAGLNAIEEMHFGKCSGFDDYAGQKIAVVGSYLLNSVAYLLIASILGVEFTLADQEMHYRQICHSWRQFYFHVYDHPELRKIQLWLVESELLQAVGRARHIRYEDAEVIVFANFPLPDAQYFDIY